MGGGTDDGTIVLGANSDNGKGNITAYLGYRNTEAVRGSQIDYSNCTLAGDFVSGCSCQGSSTKNRFRSEDYLLSGAAWRRSALG